MALHQYRKRKSDQVDGGDHFQDASTPTSSPARKRVKITQAQKQALIDNLQLEITERARHLRAHYALQSSDLRSRIERRINRIPLSLRKANMGELLLKYSQGGNGAVMTTSKAPNAQPMMKDRPLDINPTAPQTKTVSPARIPVPVGRTIKHVKEPFQIASDKENEELPSGPGSVVDSLPNLKNPKRAKAGTGPASRVVSRAGAKGGSVLSPKSHNSRTLPQSPIKEYRPTTSPAKHQSNIARPVSPLKPASPLKTAASAATSALSASIHGMVEHAKRGAGATARGLGRTASKEKAAATLKAAMGPPPRPAAQSKQQAETTRPVSQTSSHSNSSETSASSTTTTVVTKKGTKTTLASTTTKKAAAGAAKMALKKTIAGNTAGVTKKVVVAEPAAGRRVLRKRN